MGTIREIKPPRYMQPSGRSFEICCSTATRNLADIVLVITQSGDVIARLADTKCDALLNAWVYHV